MISFIALFLSATLLLALLRRAHHSQSELVFRHEVFTLRDKLRLLAIQGKIDKNDWPFEYFDYTFSKAVRDSYFITFLRLAILSHLHEKDERVTMAKKEIDAACSVNPHLDKLYSEYINAVVNHIRRQHKISEGIYECCQYIFGNMKIIKEYVVRQFKDIFFFPEISANGQVKAINSNRKILVG